MDDLPSFWTFIPGVLAGCLFIGRIARWLQFVRAMMGKPDISFGAEPNPRAWKTMLSIFAYPTPWIALALTIWGIHHIIVAPFSLEWRWFYAGFLGGPPILVALLYGKVRRIRRKHQRQPVPPK